MPDLAFLSMKPILLCFALSLTGCAHTELRTASGKVLFRTEADASRVHYAGNGVTLDIYQMDHSKSNAIMGKNVQNVTTATGAAVATSGILGLFH